MASISKAISSMCKKQTYGDHDGGRYGYASAVFFEGDDDNRDGDSGFSPVLSMEGDDDDDGTYDYAPAA